MGQWDRYSMGQWYRFSEQPGFSEPFAIIVVLKGTA
jgi:hypothetical protein